jgi:DNA-binding LacI/PurR family transcriptional regulator
LLEQVTFARQLPDLGFGAAFAAAVRVEYLTSLHAMRQQRFPVVLMNASVPKVPIPAVTTDEYGAARRLATLLTDLGHRNLCMVALAFDGRLKQRQHRTYGWFDCLSELGIAEQCTMPVRYLIDEAETVTAVGHLLGQSNPPTALVFAYGTLCDRFLDGFATAGLDIPRRLSVATFDYSSTFAQVTWCPPLTSFSFNLDRLAACAIEMTAKMLDGQEQTRSIRIPMQLNLTDSVGPAPKRR